MSESDNVGALVGKLLDGLAASSAITPILEQAIRVAQLRQDSLNLWWLRLEAVGIDDNPAWKALDAQMVPRFTPEQYKLLRDSIYHEYFVRHAVAMWDWETGEIRRDQVSALSVAQLDYQIESQSSLLRASGPLSADASSGEQKRRMNTELSAGELSNVRSRIRQRLHRFLVETEATIVLDQTASTAFERTRQQVDSLLASLAPDVLTQFRAAYERANRAEPESLSHALTSCRRIIKAVADTLYPATDEAVVGPDGRIREMTDDKYRNRLWQYASERVSHESARKLLQATIDELGRKLDLLDDLASKGVHADVSSAEADQCVLQTYLLIGDLLRLSGSTIQS